MRDRDVARAPLTGCHGRASLGDVAVVAAALLAVAWFGAVVGHALWRQVVGDSAIHLVYARNAAAGHWFQYNVGEASTGSSSPLWTALLALTPAGDAEGLMVWMHVLGALSWALSFVLVLALSRKAWSLPWCWSGGAALVWLAMSRPGLEWAMQGFETMLAVDLCLALWLTTAVWPVSGCGSCRGVAVGVLAGLVPLARLECALFAALALGVWVARHSDVRGAWRVVVAAAGAAAVVVIPYYAWSTAATGSPIPYSAQGRALAGAEASVSFSPHFAVVLVAALAAVACALGRATARRAVGAAAVLSALASASYALGFALVAPAGSHFARYTYCTAPIMALALVGGAYWTATCIGGVTARSCRLVAAGVYAAVGACACLRSTIYPFDLIVETDVADWINSSTQPDATVLAYEVQAKWGLHRRLLSLDGIVDGRVLPYARASSDLTDFLWRERPSYWIANAAVDYRPYLRNSVLHRALTSVPALRVGASTELGGIRFTVVKVRGAGEPTVQGQVACPEYPSFAGYLAVFRLDYLARGGSAGRSDRQSAGARAGAPPTARVRMAAPSLRRATHSAPRRTGPTRLVESARSRPLGEESA